MKTVFLMPLFFLQMVLSCPDENTCIYCQQKEVPILNECMFCVGGYFNEEKSNCNNKNLRLISNCWTYHLDQNQDIEHPLCMICEFGFYSTEDKRYCKRCSAENCAVCDENKCSACFHNLKLKWFQDPKKGPQCMSEKTCNIKYCLVCDQTELGNRETCLFCQPRFSTINGKCEAAILSDCMSMEGNNKDQCSICQFGYHMTIKGECALDVLPCQVCGLIMPILLVSDIVLIMYLLSFCCSKKENEFFELIKN